MVDNCFFGADILLPKKDFERFAVMACDQYTSEPEYWEDAKKITAGCASALELILPEVYLSDDNSIRINEINKKMTEYLQSGVFEEYKDCMIYVERGCTGGGIRRGIVGKVDLECYDFAPHNTALIRASEKTVAERIPPRVKIRENAAMELSHAMLLMNDTEDKIMSELSSQKDSFEKVYDFELMKGSGHITGWIIPEKNKARITEQLKELKRENNGLLFCVGDGNHSLATAKACYEKDKGELNRYALAEIVNIHEKALEFEPIYRVVFGKNPETVINDFKDYYKDKNGKNEIKYRCVYGTCEKEFSLCCPQSSAVAALQDFLDDYILKNNDLKIDYIHDEASLKKICNKSDVTGFLFEGMKKDELFPAVVADGSLPRKTFSMGHAADKRFYLEGRRIKK